MCSYNSLEKSVRGWVKKDFLKTNIFTIIIKKRSQRYLRNESAATLFNHASDDPLRKNYNAGLQK